mgnify:CR=1 FL=1
MNTIKEIGEFIRKLSTNPNTNTVTNQYLDEKKQKNLRIYLTEMLGLNPKLLLLGEAPGYKGCAVSGIPFTSEYIMLENPNKTVIFGKDKGYEKISVSNFEKERTATMIWNALIKLDKIPLLWNSFPFHPHKDRNPQSNRPPSNKETEIGKNYILHLENVFNIEHFIPVGRKAEKLLKNMNIKAEEYVPHPSRGNKSKFIEKLKTSF